MTLQLRKIEEITGNPYIFFPERRSDTYVHSFKFRSDSVTGVFEYLVFVLK